MGPELGRMLYWMLVLSKIGNNWVQSSYKPTVDRVFPSFYVLPETQRSNWLANTRANVSSTTSFQCKNAEDQTAGTSHKSMPTSQQTRLFRGTFTTQTRWSTLIRSSHCLCFSRIRITWCFPIRLGPRWIFMWGSIRWPLMRVFFRGFRRRWNPVSSSIVARNNHWNTY